VIDRSDIHLREIQRLDFALAKARADLTALRSRLESTRQWLAEQSKSDDGVRREMALFAANVIEGVMNG
jgi:hypothetical protein